MQLPKVPTSSHGNDAFQLRAFYRGVVCVMIPSLSLQGGRCCNIPCSFYFMERKKEKKRQNRPEFLINKPTPITQKHVSRDASKQFLLLFLFVVITIDTLMRFFIRWLSLPSKFSFDLMSLFIFVCLCLRDLLTVWLEVFQGYFRW